MGGYKNFAKDSGTVLPAAARRADPRLPRGAGSAHAYARRPSPQRPACAKRGVSPSARLARWIDRLRMHLDIADAP